VKNRIKREIKNAIKAGEVRCIHNKIEEEICTVQKKKYFCAKDHCRRAI
jgi:hypothetical protein